MHLDWKAWSPPLAAIMAVGIAVGIFLWAREAERVRLIAEADVAALALVGERFAERQALLAGRQPLFRAETAALAGSILQSHVLKIAELSGVAVGNSEVTSTQDREISLGIDFQGQEANLVRAMLEIDRSVPFISIDELRMEALGGAPGDLTIWLLLSAGYSSGAPQ